MNEEIIISVSKPPATGNRLHLLWRLALTVLAAAVLTPSGMAVVIDVPNASFELPSTNYAGPAIDSWQKTPQPGWFDPVVIGSPWDQLSGAFLNTPVGDSAHIDNADGSQAAFLFALTQAGLTQDLIAPFAVGQSFDLTVGIIGGGGGMAAGSTIMIGMYYRDSENNTVTFAANLITFDGTTALFPNTTHLVDFTVSTAAVQAGDAWAGKPIGVILLALDATNGGYWDLDNVRLSSIPEPATWGLAASGLGAMLLMRGRFGRRA